MVDIQVVSAIIFVILLIVFVITKRKNIVLQKIVFPLIYMVLYRSNFGLKFINKFATKYKEQVKFFGYLCIGLGFTGMVLISVNMILLIYNLLTAPDPVAGVSLVLPFTNIPGIGYLSFFHWIIAIFILAIVHEFAHGIVARAHDVPVDSSGFAFFAIIAPIIPAAFVEPNEKKLRKQSDVVQYSVFAAGAITNIVIALILLLALPYVGNPTKLAPFEDSITEPVGFSFDLIEGDYPAINAGIEPGIITQVNGEDTLDFNAFVNSLYGVRPNEEVTLTTDKGSFTLITAEAPDNPRRGFVGVRPISNERVAKPGLEWLKSPFEWVKDMFKWLFLLNLFIGLFNLLPLGIVDGGRMLNTLLQRTMKNKAIASKIWGLISLFFLILIILGLVSSYIGNPLNFFR